MTLNKLNIKFLKKKIAVKKSIENVSALRNKSIGYITSILACASIPHSNINKNFFKRSNGKTSLKIISDPEYGLPYGLIPRIIMIWLCTEVKFKKSKIIYLGKNQNDFIKKLGIIPTGGINGSINRIKKQIMKLFHSTISLTNENKNEHKFVNLNIVDNGIFFWNKKNKNKLYWNNKIVLSKKFFNEIKLTSLPIDLRVTNILRSSLAIDIYIWLTWRARMINKRVGIIISWKKLKLQFGSNYCNSSKGLFNFKREFIKQLKIVYFFYSNVNIRILKFGLKLKYSISHVPSLN